MHTCIQRSVRIRPRTEGFTPPPPDPLFRKLDSRWGEGGGVYRLHLACGVSDLVEMNKVYVTA